MSAHERLVLASASPRRKALMEEAGLAFEIVIPHADETIPPCAPPEEAAVEIARRKVLCVADDFPDAVIIGADTIVVTAEGRVLGKPFDSDDAREMLAGLSETTHRVITGVYIMATAARVSLGRAVTTEIVFDKMCAEAIDRYVRSGEAMGKAGAYAIQETGDAFVREVSGSFTNVVGLPMEALAEMLDEIRRRSRQHPAPGRVT